MAINCPKCGKNNEDTAVACVDCKEPFIEGAAKDSPQTFTGWKSWLIPGIIIVVGALLTFHFLTVKTKIVDDRAPISYQSSTEDDPKLLKGITYTRTQGVTGTKLVKSKVWIGSNGSYGDSKVVTEVIEQNPQDEVIVNGALSRNDAANEAKSQAQGFMQSWKSGDYEAMALQSTTESLRGFTSANLQQGFTATGEILESFTVGEPTIKTMDELTATQKAPTSSSSSYSYGDEKKTASVSSADFPTGTPVIAEIPITYSTNSKALGKKNNSRIIYSAYRDGAWHILYFSQLAGIAVTQNKQTTKTGYSTTETGDVSLDYLIIYPEHILFVVHETNTTHSKYGGSSINSHFSSGYESNILVTTDASNGEKYSLNSDKSSKFEYSIKEGATQSGYLYVEPGIPAGAKSISVTFKQGSSSDGKGDVFFNNINFR
ncbi:MAG: G5 domain-containing protein [Thermoleophilia bacterium]